MTKIVVPFFPKSLGDVEKIQSTEYEKADIVEWRADFLPMNEIFLAAPLIFEKFRKMPILFTLRTKDEGGELQVTPEVYKFILIRIAKEYQPAFLDLEYFSFPEAFTDLEFYKEKLVLSYHDISGVAEDLSQRMQTLASLVPAFIKFAVTPRNKKELLMFMTQVAALSEAYPISLIAVAMGKLGIVSRVFPNLTGSVWTFASLHAGASMAGQLPIEETRVLLELLENE